MRKLSFVGLLTTVSVRCMSGASLLETFSDDILTSTYSPYECTRNSLVARELIRRKKRALRSVRRYLSREKLQEEYGFHWCSLFSQLTTCMSGNSYRPNIHSLELWHQWFTNPKVPTTVHMDESHKPMRHVH